MKVVVVAVGKLKDPGLRAALDDYRTRVRRHVAYEELEIRDDHGFGRAIPAESHVVACEVLGEAMSSVAFARKLELWGSRNKGIVTFLVGGAEGIPKAVSSSADVRLSLSTMTLPHRLARVLLAEQIYRAMTILRGEPYARE